MEGEDCSTWRNQYEQKEAEQGRKWCLEHSVQEGRMQERRREHAKARGDSPMSRAEERGLYPEAKGICAPKRREEPELYLTGVILTPWLREQTDRHACSQSCQSIFADR